MKLYKQCANVNTYLIIPKIVRFGFIFLILSSLIVFFYPLVRITNTTALPSFSLIVKGLSATLLMMMVVSLIASILGSFYAWIVSTYTFPFSNVFSHILLLPLVFPPLITGIAYIGFFDIGGITYQLFDKFHIDIMNPVSLYIILILHTFPYMYIIALMFFRREYQDIRRTYISLSIPRYKRLLPYMRTYSPFLLRGVSIISMEILGEFALSSYFGYNTLNTLINTEWRGKGNISTAIGLGFITFLCALSLVKISLLFKASRIPEKNKHLSRLQHTSPLKQTLLTFICTLPLILIVIIPFSLFIRWAFLLDIQFIPLFNDMLSSFLVSSSASLFIILIAFLSAYVLSFSHHNRFDSFFPLGYSLPSSLTGIALLSLFAFIQHFFKFNTNITFLTLFLAYLIRYINTAYASLSLYFHSIGHTITTTYLTYGLSSIKLLYIHISTLRKRLFILFILLFIEISKDLGLTIIIRPFNFNNLATRIYELTKDEQTIRTAPYALALMILHIVIFMCYSPYKKKLHDIPHY